ncbi:ABC transporter permease [Tunturiibacter empetritectus]|uniref:Permease n=1 Tax=Tunturiibacter lichenicola TaxID=2051959 RepID=A0A852VE73_9BACT|nr:ABC transporter permease [Edaphobacter lichenicola]NYF89837.1 putative permease [Edaphobacter lichenicola]
MQDIRVALRQFYKSPGFAITVVLTIALGIGANTAIFTLVHAILLKSLPVADPKTLFRVGDQDDCCVNGGFINDNGDFDLFSYELYKHFQETTPEFERLAAMQAGGEQKTTRRGSEPAKSERAQYVSGNFFTTFGIGAFAGRMLTDADDTPGGAPAVVMSYQAWQSDYGSDPKVVGSTFYLQGQPATVVGIAPPGFFGDRIRSNPPGLWIPLAMEPAIEGKNSILHVPDSNWLYAVGRMKPGVSITALQEKMSGSLRQFLSAQPNYSRNGGSTIIPKQHVVIVPGGAGIQNLQKQTGKGLYLLMTISGLVLLVACANVANLLLARGTTRRADTSVRMALGAARSRLIRQMLTESLLLGCAGGLAGLAVAYAGTRMILALAFPDSPQLPIAASPSLAVLGFAFLLSLLTGVVFGVVPAWITSHSDPAEALRGANRSTRDRSSLPQRSLIVFQAALSLVLLVGAGLLTKSLRNMEHQKFGIQTANRYVLHLDPAGAGYKPETLPAFYRTLEDQFGSLPGVQSVGLALYSTLEGNNWGEGVFVDGRPAPGPNDHNGSSWDRVSNHFFETVGQPVLRGRGFTDQDTATSQKVAVVNQAFVKKFFPKEDPVGRHFGIFEQKYSSTFEIVGVVADAKYTNPRDEVRTMYFRPLTQTMTGLTDPNEAMAEGRGLYINSVTLFFRSEPQNLDATMRRTLANINPDLTVLDLHSLDYQVADNFTQERLIARLTMLFGALALVLASVGLYGITSYQVARRTSEIGLRMALGADRGNVVRMVMRSAFVQAGLGLAIGVPIAIFGARAMADQLYGVRSYDPVSLLIAVAVLLGSATVAGFIPARRAANIEPMTALRTE